MMTMGYSLLIIPIVIPLTMLHGTDQYKSSFKMPVMQKDLDPGPLLHAVDAIDSYQDDN